LRFLPSPYAPPLITTPLENTSLLSSSTSGPNLLFQNDSFSLLLLNLLVPEICDGNNWCLSFPCLTKFLLFMRHLHIGHITIFSPSIFFLLSARASCFLASSTSGL